MLAMPVASRSRGRDRPESRAPLCFRALEPVNDGRPAEGRAGNHRGGIPLTEMVRRPDGTASEAAAL